MFLLCSMTLHTLPAAATGSVSGRATFGKAIRNSAFALGLCLALAALHAADFEVRTPSDQYAFQINGVDSPTLTLVRGRTYSFDVLTSAGFHPFHIESPGVDANDTDAGTINYTLPTANANYYYNCVVHGDTMRG